MTSVRRPRLRLEFVNQLFHAGVLLTERADRIGALGAENAPRIVAVRGAPGQGRTPRLR